MPTREEGINQADSGVRGTIPQPTDLTDYVPGASVQFIPPVPPVVRNEIIADTTEMYNHAGEMVGKVIGEYKAPLDELTSGVAEIHSNIVGGIGNEVDGMQSHAAKIAGKVQGNITNGMREIYSGMNDIGLPTPTIDQVRYGNASGDHLGSILPTDPTAPRQKRPDRPHVDPQSKLNPNPQSPGVIQDDSGLVVHRQQLPVDPELHGNPSNPVVTTDGGDVCDDPNNPACPYHNNPGDTTECVDSQGQSHGFYELYQPFMPRVVDGWVDTLGREQTITHCGVQLTEPVLLSSTTDSSVPDAYDEVCVTDGYFFHPPNIGIDTFGSIGFAVPAGSILMYDMRNGRLWAGKTIPAGFAGLWGQHPCTPTTPVVPTHDGPGVVPNEPPPPGGDGGDGPYVPGESCPALPNLSCGPTGKSGFPALTANTDACGVIESALDKIKNADVTFDSWVKMATGDKPDPGFSSGLMKGIFGADKNVLPGLIGRLSAWMQTVVKDSTSKLDCDPQLLLPITTFQGLLQLLEKWLGIIPDQLVNKVDQMSNTACQSRLPGGSEADSAYLANTISQPEWECWQKAEGNHLGPAQRVRDASRTKLSPDQYVALYKRGYITEEVFRKALRECGVITEGDVYDLLNYADQWPQMSDIIRFMTRDVADPKVVALSGLDTDFELKWTGRVKEYGNAAGITDDIARDFWRAHWEIPSYTQLIEMYHRLRPGLVAPEDEVTLERVTEALKQNDMAPEWVNRMIMIAEHVIPSGDAVKAFYLHSVDETFLYNNYRDHGSNDDAAKTMVDYHTTERTRRDKAAAGFPTIKALAKSYARCEITLGQFTDTVDLIAVNDDQKLFAQDAAKITKAIEDRRLTIRSVMRPYMRGLIDDGQASQLLAEAGIESDCVPALIRGWQRKQAKQSKHLNASQLCDLRDKGIITADEQSAALVRSGWDSVDAWRIVGSCEAKLTEKERKAAEKAAKDAKTAADKAAKAAKKAKREAECGPPPCPANRQKSNPASGAGP